MYQTLRTFIFCLWNLLIRRMETNLTSRQFECLEVVKKIDFSDDRQAMKKFALKPKHLGQSWRKFPIKLRDRRERILFG